MSSDSEDDCYGNIAQKLQSLKQTYETATKTNDFLKPETSKSLDNSISVEDYIPTNNSTLSTADLLVVESDCEEISLDTIIEQNTKRNTRSSKRSADVSEDNIIQGSKRTRTTRKSRQSKENERDKNELSVDTNQSGKNNETLSVTNQRGRGKRGASTSSNTEVEQRGRGRGHRSRGRTPRRRGRGRRRYIQDLFEFFGEFEREFDETSSVPSQMRSNLEPQYPTYSVGNTFEYPDQSENQALFTKKPQEAVLLTENEANDSFENEELSVKIYWRNTDVHKFILRRYQKLTQVFKFFAEMENVSLDKLLFTYNDKILKSDDTPDSIGYSIAKFIDGGIITQSVSNLVKKDGINEAKTGFKLKFQCQNVKRPFETVIQPEDKMSVAMMMCAEHFEMPIDKMKFFFDGELVSGKSTPIELELEGGECIDVKIMS